MLGNRLKGKRDVMVTEYTTPYLSMSFFGKQGAIRTVKEFLHCVFYKFVGALTKPGPKKSKEVSSSFDGKSGAIGEETRVVIPFH
jgi:hypothetical protein